MILFLQTIGACMYSRAYPYSRLCGGLSGLFGSGGRVIYWDLWRTRFRGGGGAGVLGSRILTNTFLHS